MNRLEIPLLDIPSIGILFTLKIMSVNDIIAINERTFKQKLYNAQYNTAIIAGYWNQPATWIGSNPNY